MQVFACIPFFVGAVRTVACSAFSGASLVPIAIYMSLIHLDLLREGNKYYIMVAF